jgi:alkylglycerol monooxygenase
MDAKDWSSAVDLITLSIPFFFLAIGLESWVGMRRGRRVMRAPDAICDLSLGLLQVLVTVVWAGALIAAYRSLFEHHRLHTFSSDSALAWLLLLLGVDFFYYWFHRASHRVNLAWAAHAPHHSSEDYNLAVALRQGPFQPFVSSVFYLPLAIAGFPVEMFAAMGAINTVYQFWIHTELVSKLGPLEWFLNTPSHHRVHHGINPKYLDKNHAGMFIVWDRMFGTFVNEQERPTYGTVQQLTTWNPLKAALQPFFDLIGKSLEAPGLWKLAVWAMPPEWTPSGPVAVPDLTQRVRFDARAPRRLLRAALFAFVALMIAATLYLFLVVPNVTYVVSLAGALALTLTMGVIGAVLDKRAAD